MQARLLELVGKAKYQEVMLSLQLYCHLYSQLPRFDSFNDVSVCEREREGERESVCVRETLTQYIRTEAKCVFGYKC